MFFSDENCFIWMGYGDDFRWRDGWILWWRDGPFKLVFWRYLEIPWQISPSSCNLLTCVDFQHIWWFSWRKSSSNLKNLNKTSTQLLLLVFFCLNFDCIWFCDFEVEHIRIVVVVVLCWLLTNRFSSRKRKRYWNLEYNSCNNCFDKN